MTVMIYDMNFPKHSFLSYSLEELLNISVIQFVLFVKTLFSSDQFALHQFVGCWFLSAL